MIGKRMMRLGCTESRDHSIVMVFVTFLCFMTASAPHFRVILAWFIESSDSFCSYVSSMIPVGASNRKSMHCELDSSSPGEAFEALGSSLPALALPVHQPPQRPFERVKPDVSRSRQGSHADAGCLCWPYCSSWWPYSRRIKSLSSRS